MKKRISFTDPIRCSWLIIRLCLLLGLLVHTIPGLAQDATGDYLIVDSTTYFGVDFKRPLIPLPKQQSPDPHHGRAFFDGDLVVARHAHGDLCKAFLPGKMIGFQLLEDAV